MRILTFGSYDQGAGRNRILAQGLAAAGAELLDCPAPLWRGTEHKLTLARGGPAALAGLLPRLAWSWALLLARHARLPAYDAMLLGPTTHLDLPLAALLARRRGAALVFDPLVSATETLEDRGLLPPAGHRLAAVSRLERRLWRLPPAILADSEAHARAWRHSLGIGRGGQRVCVLPVGSPDLGGLGWEGPGAAGSGDSDPGGSLGSPSDADRAARDVTGEGPEDAAAASCGQAPSFRVLYFGQFIPLHGVEHILAAAEMLREQPEIRFQLVGRGQCLAQAQATAARLGLRNVEIHPVWLPLEQLRRRFIAPAGLCLGIFGDRPKAERVLPYKVYAALAAGKPVISRDSPALRELLAPGHEILALPPADPAALAQAIRALAADPARCTALARAGQLAWRRRFSPSVLGRRLLAELEGGLGRWRTSP